MSGGSDVVLVSPAVLRELAPPRPGGDAHKGMRGCVLVVGGSRETPGAALLAGLASLRAGAGVLKIATAESVAVGLALTIPEARVTGLPEAPDGDIGEAGAEQLGEMAGAAQAIVLGPGLLSERLAQALLPCVLDGLAECALVVDALALRAVTPGLVAPHRSRTVLIPNSKEAAELAGVPVEDVENDARAVLEALVRAFGCTVAVRGGETFVGSPGSPVYRDVSGVPGLGTSGSGDVLAGFLAGLLARGTEPLAATLWAVRAHAEAGRRLSERVATLGFLARELLDELGPAATALGA